MRHGDIVELNGKTLAIRPVYAKVIRYIGTSNHYYAIELLDGSTRYVPATRITLAK